MQYTAPSYSSKKITLFFTLCPPSNTGLWQKDWNAYRYENQEKDPKSVSLQGSNWHALLYFNNAMQSLSSTKIQHVSRTVDSICHYQSINLLKEKKPTYCRKSRCLQTLLKVSLLKRWVMDFYSLNCSMSGKDVTILQYFNRILTETCHSLQSQMQLYQNPGKPEQSLLAHPGEKGLKSKKEILHF